MATINDVLLRVTGDVSDAKAELAKLDAWLKEFDAKSADAEISLDTSAFTRALEQAKAALLAFGQQTVDPDIGLDDAAFHAELAKARAELAALDRQEIDVDVDSSSLARLATHARSSAGSVGILNPRLGKLVGWGTKLVPIIGGLGTVFAGLAASLASAVVGAGALAIAFVATLFPAAVLVVGAIRRYKEQSDKAGTAANDLKTASSDLGTVFDQTLGPAADNVFKGLADALPDISEALPKLKPAFNDLGRAVRSFISDAAGFVTSTDSGPMRKKPSSTWAPPSPR